MTFLFIKYLSGNTKKVYVYKKHINGVCNVDRYNDLFTYSPFLGVKEKTKMDCYIASCHIIMHRFSVFFTLLSTLKFQVSRMYASS